VIPNIRCIFDMRLLLVISTLFSGEEIKKFLQVEFKINNYLYLDRIVDIAQGNPRLAVMAAQI
jgi:hypothetical protein